MEVAKSVPACRIDRIQGSGGMFRRSPAAAMGKPQFEALGAVRNRGQEVLWLLGVKGNGASGARALGGDDTPWLVMHVGCHRDRTGPPDEVDGFRDRTVPWRFVLAHAGARWQGKESVEPDALQVVAWMGR